MNKQDIYVVIDSEETREKAQQILENSGEVIKHLSSLYVTYKELLHLIFDDTNQEWCVEPNWHKIASKTRIDISMLETLLKLKELTFPREMKVWNNNTMHLQDVVYSIYNEQYITMDSDGCFRGWLYASEIEPLKPSPIDEIKEFAKERGFRIRYIEKIDIDEPEFVLPEKWAVKRTEENAYTINKWANSFIGYNGFINYNGYVIAFNSQGTPFVSDQCKATEITFEQFKKHVLKEN